MGGIKVVLKFKFCCRDLIQIPNAMHVVCYYNFSFFRCAQDFVTEKDHRRKESERYKSESRCEEWEKFLQQKQLQVWRRPSQSAGLYEYKGKQHLTIKSTNSHIHLLISSTVQLWRRPSQSAVLYKHKG